MASVQPQKFFSIQQLHGTDGVRNIADDIFVIGTTEQQDGTALDQGLKRLSDKGLT